MDKKVLMFLGVCLFSGLLLLSGCDNKVSEKDNKNLEVQKNNEQQENNGEYSYDDEGDNLRPTSPEEMKNLVVGNIFTVSGADIKKTEILEEEKKDLSSEGWTIIQNDYLYGSDDGSEYFLSTLESRSDDGLTASTGIVFSIEATPDSDSGELADLYSNRFSVGLSPMSISDLKPSILKGADTIIGVLDPDFDIASQEKYTAAEYDTTAIIPTGEVYNKVLVATLDDEPRITLVQFHDTLNQENFVKSFFLVFADDTLIHAQVDFYAESWTAEELLMPSN